MTNILIKIELDKDNIKLFRVLPRFGLRIVIINNKNGEQSRQVTNQEAA